VKIGKMASKIGGVKLSSMAKAAKAAAAQHLVAKSAGGNGKIEAKIESAAKMAALRNRHRSKRRQQLRGSKRLYG